MRKIITILISVFIGAVLTFVVPRALEQKEEPLVLNEVYEIKKIKHLHLVKHTIQNILFLYKDNNPQNSVNAIVKTKCIVSSYINLEATKFEKEGDYITKIILPQPQLADPFFDINGLEVAKVSDVNFTWFKNNAAVAWLNDFKGLLVQEQQKSSKIAIKNGILNDAKEQAVQYIQGIMSVTGNKDVVIEFTSIEL